MPGLADTQGKNGPIGRHTTAMLLALGCVDRGIVVAAFGSRYVSTDDAVIWGAAMDYGRGSFHGPYYYGQNYGPMLEALLAAPFTHLGIPLWWLMPTVTTILCLLPYWSFALWHQKHGRTTAAAVFAAVPLLLPVEFSLMTTMPRGFVIGLAPLALLPWILDMRNGILRSLFTGITVSAAWYMNPNSIIFSAAFLCWYAISQRPWPKHWLFIVLGLVPGAMAYLCSQAWCDTHPDRIIHHLSPEDLVFAPSRVLDGLSRLDAHFQWLMPLVWPIGSLAGALLVLFTAQACWQRQWPLAAGSLVSIILTALSLGFGKIHQGWDSVFFPLSRMFLAVPLTIAWCGSQLLRRPRMSIWTMSILLLVCCGAIAWKASALNDVADKQVRAQREWVGVRPVALLRTDEQRLRAICDKHDVGVILPLQLGSDIWPQFRNYLYPALDEGLPPTYMCDYERRYWVRDALMDSVIPNILITGGSPERWKRIMAADPRFIDADDLGPDEVHLMVANTERTDDLSRRIFKELQQ